MLTERPEVLLGILRSAHSASPDPRLDAVLARFRADWLRLGLRRYPMLASDLEDAVQIALVKLVSPARLATLHSVDKFSAWVRSLFVHTVLDLIRRNLRASRWRAYLDDTDDGDSEAALRSIPSSHPTPEDLASHRERVAIVLRLTSQLAVAQAKFVEDLTELEIAQRQGLTRYAVASRVRRTRQRLQEALGDI